MSNENIFRFMAVRPANLRNKQAAIEKRAPLYAAADSKSELYRSLEAARGRNASKEEIVAIAQGFKNTSAYVRVISQMTFDVGPLLKWMEANRNKPLNDIDLRNDIKALYGPTLNEIVDSPEFTNSYMALADTILSDNITREGVERRDDVVVAFKLLNLLKRAKGDESTVKSEEKLGRFITHSIVVLPELSNLRGLPSGAKDVSKRQDTGEVKPDERAQELDQLRIRLQELETAHRELSRLASDPSAIYRPKRDSALLARIASMERRISELSLRQKQGEGTQQEKGQPASQPLADAFSLRQTGGMHEGFVLSLNAVRSLSQTSQKVLQDLRLEPKQINPIKAVDRIEQEINYTLSLLPVEYKPTKMLLFGGVLVDKNMFRYGFGMGYKPFGDMRPPIIDELPVPCSIQAGIGDLLVVKQTLKAYELADFAHVENVLAGEMRERTHRRLNLREEITVLETERETEEERDLQSTERNELQNEAEKTIKSQLELEAGLQVSGSYGPCVSFSSSLNAGYSTSTEETERKAMSYSREVTEKTAERIRERVREERRLRVVEEIEEINKHIVNNASGGHIRGIYRWLNKIYDAQVFNYGQRMMFDFVIPEPAAYFLYALVENPPEGMEIDEPEPPTYPYPTQEGLKELPLTPKILNRTNYHRYVSQYHVTNAPVPPPQFKMVAYVDKQDGTTTQDGTTKSGDIGRAGIIRLENGYAAFAVKVHCISAPVSPIDYWLGIGADCRTYLVGGEPQGQPGFLTHNFDDTDILPERREKELSISYLFPQITSFALGVDVFCELTKEGFAKWQHDMYDAIMNAYLQQKADYEEKLAAMAIQQGGMPVLGRNPLENRRIERDELKKLSLIMLTRFTGIGFEDLFYEGGEPVINVQHACQAGKHIRFCENAFEWNNILYVFYPYFWGRHDSWVPALHLTDPDPDFAAFLKAGAARVQVPVRPGFERAVAYFCQTGQIPEGNEIGLREDDLYLPIVDEITENLGKLDGGVPYPADSQPWEVTVPTSLVVLQNLEEIQEIPAPNGIRDILTGSKPNLLNTNA